MPRRSRQPWEAAVVAQAASATYRGSLEDARAAVLEALPNAVRRGLTAGEIMSRPARFVSPDDTVAHAMVLCQRHRQSGMLVGEPNPLVGVVTREDLDKAIGHGLSHAPVKSVMGSDVVSCGEDTPLAESCGSSPEPRAVACPSCGTERPWS